MNHVYSLSENIKSSDLLSVVANGYTAARIINEKSDYARMCDLFNTTLCIINDKGTGKDMNIFLLLFRKWKNVLLGHVLQQP